MAALLGTVCRRRFRAMLVIGALATLVFTPTQANASEKITANASNVALKVDSKGHAVVYWTNLRGERKKAAVWGAINARYPNPDIPQVKFKVDYSGGYMKLGYPLWKTIRNQCRPYDGPTLPWFVMGCKAPDGSYWALQQFRRLLPNLGIAPWLPRHRARELHLSHWTGQIADLEVYADWVMSFRHHELFGRLTYKGVGVYGYEFTTSGAPLDGYGRLVYLDTYNSRLGAGWKRENSFLARRKGTPGHFCYHFVWRKRYAGYPAGPDRPPANGQQYRLTAGGPGVTPMVMARVDGLPNFDPDNPAHLDLEAAMNPLKTVVVGDDDGCFYG